MNEKVKPDFEMFFGIPYKVFCGKCERLIATAGKYWPIDQIREEIKECKYCGTEVDWSAEIQRNTT